MGKRCPRASLFILLIKPSSQLMLSMTGIRSWMIRQSDILGPNKMLLNLKNSQTILLTLLVGSCGRSLPFELLVLLYTANVSNVLLKDNHNKKANQGMQSVESTYILFVYWKPLNGCFYKQCMLR